jgi:Mce-associated membrane protein
VEDQQSAAGDLTEDIRDDESATSTTVTHTTIEGEAVQIEAAGEIAGAAAESTDDEPVEPGDDADTIRDGSAEDTGGEATVRARKPVGKRLAIGVIAMAALLVGSAAFAGAMVQPYLVDRATVNTKLEIARTASDTITTLWTYTPQNVDTLADRAAAYLSGDFEAQYRKFMDAIAAPNKQAQVTNNTHVIAAAVESLDGANATAIVYTNTTSTSPATKDIPSLKYLSYRLVMKRDHTQWLVTRMTTITSLDLTPQL